jgi:peptide-methionine (S)-S-oxide reductase
VSFRELAELFLTVHDPTTLNRQGPDAGTQYRSAIFYHNEEQKKIAEGVMASLSEQGVWKNPIVTQLAPLEKFYPAEDYHQGYYRANPQQGYCRGVIEPKVAKFRQKFARLLKTS